MNAKPLKNGLCNLAGGNIITFNSNGIVLRNASKEDFEKLGRVWYIDYNDKSYPIYLSDAILKRSNIFFAMTSWFILNGETEPKLSIFIDSNFINAILLSDTLRKFFLLHELGHIVNDDVHIEDEPLKYVNERLNGSIPDMEFKADRFAIEHMPNEREQVYHDIQEFIDRQKEFGNTSIGITEFET